MITDPLPYSVESSRKSGQDCYRLKVFGKPTSEWLFGDRAETYLTGLASYWNTYYAERRKAQCLTRSTTRPS